jgi:hypothetical protein
MKKLTLMFLIIVGTFQIIFGQIEKPYSKGTIVSGGSFSANFDKDEFVTNENPIITYVTKNNVFESDIYVGYFLLNQLSIGFISDITFTKQIYTNSQNPGSDELGTNNFLIGPFLRYYSKLGLFCEGSISFGFLNYTPSSIDTKYTKLSLSAGIGYDLILSKSVAIEPMVKYRFIKFQGEQNVGHRTKNMGLSISVGFSIYLDTKRNE